MHQCKVEPNGLGTPRLLASVTTVNNWCFQWQRGNIQKSTNIKQALFQRPKQLSSGVNVWLPGVPEASKSSLDFKAFGSPQIHLSEAELQTEAGRW